MLQCARVAQSHFNTDNQMKQRINHTKAYFGILDGIYPIMIVTDSEFIVNPTQPDDISNEKLPLNTEAVKERRARAHHIETINYVESHQKSHQPPSFLKFIKDHKK